ncbi:MAG: hypothetical protein NTU85_03015 [Candidatus Kaiserbacteria bacterium]|nr:hypothetical protein [Candidatus Kaiserbacteria bacterium]
MGHKRFWVAASIIGGVVIIGFVLSVPHTRDVGETAVIQNETITPPITLRDSFKKGVHMITGALEASNACFSVTADAVILDNASGVKNILIKISMPDNTGVCLQLPTRMNFSTTISAPANLPLRATVNDREASTTVL